MKKKIAIVVQRFGQKVIGGAEHHAMLLANKLQNDLGWEVDVLTTTALDYLSWENHFPPGASQEGNSKVIRFNSLNGRSPLFKLHNQLMKRLNQVYTRVPILKYLFLPFELLWFLLQGPICLDLINYIARKRNEYDQFIFFTYLYAPTMFGIWPVKNKAILIPTAHDELAFHFTMTSYLLRAPRLVFCNSSEESKLVKAKLSPREQNKVKIVGIGLDLPPKGLTQTSNDTPKYMLYLGRIGKGKGIDQLIRAFIEADLSCELWLAGKVDPQFNIPRHSKIKLLGVVSEAHKWNLLEGCLCVVNSSPHESLSLIVLEGIASEKPVIVNGHSPVLHHYSTATETVFSFFDDASLKKLLQEISTINWNSTVQKEKLNKSRQWLDRRYSWSNILDIFQKHI